MVNKITEADLINKGVVGLPDVPGLTTIEMQNKFEEISRDVIIPRFNELIDCTVSASDEFSKLSTYNVGDYCIYQSVLYKCTTEITTAGEWDATKWKATAIDKELKEISSTPENKDAISDKYDSSKTYAVGDYCIYNDTLYKCKTAVTSAEEFDSSKWEATNCGKELVALNSNLTTPDEIVDYYNGISGGTNNFIVTWLFDGNGNKTIGFIPLSPIVMMNYKITINQATIQGIGAYTSGITILSNRGNGITFDVNAIGTTNYSGRYGFATLSFEKKS